MKAPTMIVPAASPATATQAVDELVKAIQDAQKDGASALQLRGLVYRSLMHGRVLAGAQ